VKFLIVNDTAVILWHTGKRKVITNSFYNSGRNYKLRFTYHKQSCPSLLSPPSPNPSARKIYLLASRFRLPRARGSRSSVPTALARRLCCASSSGRKNHQVE